MPKYGGFEQSWFKLYNLHKKQCNSMSAAWMIFISGGMKIAWGIYEQPLIKTFNSKFGDTHMVISWFIGAMIGTKIATMFVHKLSKNVAYYLSGILVFLGGVTFVSFPNSCYAAVAARYMDGCAFGMTLLQAFVIGGEFSARLLRGTIMSTERVAVWIGFSAQISYSTIFFDKTIQSSDRFLSDDQLHGLVSICLGLLSILFTAAYPLESPVYLHINQRETDSIRSLMQLQGCNHPNNQIFEIFDDNKQWIRENASQSFKDEIQGGIKIFLKLAFLRSLVSLAISLPFHWAYRLSSTMAFESNNYLIAYGFAGLLGSLLSLFVMDCQGRRMTSAFSLCIGGTILLAIGGIFLEFEINIDLPCQMKVVTFLLLAYQVVNAFGFAPATTIYISEAFALPLKTSFIAGIILIDNLVMVTTSTVVLSLPINYEIFFFVMGVLNCIACVMVIFCFPETKHLSLRECQQKFTNAEIEVF